MATIFLYEIAGTAMLTRLGGGVVANVVLGKTKGNGGGWLLINFGWGLAVFAGVFIAYKSGGHINPAVTIGMLASGAAEYADGIPVTVGTTLSYLIATTIGGFLGGIGAGWPTGSIMTPRRTRQRSWARSPPAPRSAPAAGTWSPRSSRPSCWCW